MKNIIDFNSIDANSVLQQLFEAGKIDSSDVSYAQEQDALKKREEILKLHKNRIWQGKDGKWRTYLPDPQSGRKLKCLTSLKSLEDVIVEYYSVQMNNPTIEEVFEEWLDYRLEIKKIVQSTANRYTDDFKRFYAEFGKNRIKSTTVEDFRTFLEVQVGKFGLTSKSYNNLTIITNGIVRYAKRKKLIDFTPEDVANDLDVSNRDFKSTVKNDEDEVFNVDETDKLVKYLIANQDIWNLGLLLMFFTGMRIGELVALRWEDVSPDVIHIRKTETRYKNADGKYVFEIKKPKTDAGYRDIVIPQAFQWIIPAIAKLNDDEEFLISRNGKRLTTSCIRKRFARVCDKVNVKRRSPHKIRKTYCSILFENKIDEKIIEKQMGHTDIECSKEFYRKYRQGLDKKIEAISSIPEFGPKFSVVGKNA